MDQQSVAWPSGEPSYRFRPPATDESGTLDALAAVLDATPRHAERVSVRLAIGRRTDVLGPRREALEALSGHDDVTVHDDHTIGTVPLAGETFDALVRLSDDIDRAIVFDTDGVAIADLRDAVLRFALPADAAAELRDGLEAVGGDRIERVD